MKFLIRVFDQRFINPRQTLVSPALALATRDKSLSQAQTDPFFKLIRACPLKFQVVLSSLSRFLAPFFATLKFRYLSALPRPPWTFLTLM